MHKENCPHPGDNKHYYAYIYGNPLQATSYYKTHIQPEFGYGSRLVAIYAKGNDQYPDEFSKKLKHLIADALSSGLSQPSGGENVIVFMNVTQ